MKHLIIVLLLAGCAGGSPFEKNWSPPTHQGVALPTPVTPLKEVRGIFGSIPANTPETLDLYVRSFDEIAFKIELSGPHPWILKHNRPLKYFVHGFDRGQEIVWREIADTLETLTGTEIKRVDNLEMRTESVEDVPFAVTNPREQGGVVLRNYGSFGLPTGFVEKYGSFCFSLMSANEDGSIFGGSVIIGPSNSVFSECLMEEMAQLMGLPNDQSSIRESMFNDETNGEIGWLTWHDAILLRTLYDYRLKPGMPRATALPIVRTIIGELLAELNR